MDSSTKTGVLLVNLGTPAAPETAPVRSYLREFLSDPRVLDLPAAGRNALLYGVILPFRPKQSAAAYRKIWGEEGSPLLVHGKALTAGVASALAGTPVELAMRYGQPSVQAGLERLEAAGCDALVVLPLYPQYASSSTGSTVEAVYRLCAQRWNTPFVRVVPPFYDQPEFIDSFAAVARPILDELEPDFVLFSYHGLPVRQVQKSAPDDARCGAEDGSCCAELRTTNRSCYRAQCLETTRLLSAALKLDDAHHATAFQSRLGRTPWVQPYTDQIVPTLARKGVQRLAVLCPSFVADCLETIEEIGIRARHDFIEAGGTELHLIPSLNAHPTWVEACAGMTRRYLLEA